MFNDRYLRAILIYRFLFFTNNRQGSDIFIRDPIRTEAVHPGTIDRSPTDPSTTRDRSS